MATEKSFGYEQTLLYGNYTKDLGSFAKFEAARQLDQKNGGVQGSEDHVIYKKRRFKKLNSFWTFMRRCGEVRDAIFLKVGEDWIFLAILGIVMAFLSFTMDYIIEKCQEAKFWLYEELQFSLGLQYVAWVSYSMLFILFAVGFTHLVSPQAIGSGIPEMKTILRGVVLKEYLTFKTLIAKVVGLCSSLGSTLPFGKEGPFVHVASIVATLLSKAIGSFRGIYENESRRSEMLAAACAVGVAGTFAAPIGGVLFSIEVTATYFAVRNYWRGFFSAVCGALVFRLMAFWFKDEETITALFRTNLRTEFPFDALELFAFAAIGVACGFGGALFILTHRNIILFTRRHKKLSRFLQKNRFIYPSIITFIIASLTFPPGLGQFFGGELTGKMAINELFSNITWTTGQAEDMEDEAILRHWRHPLTNVYVTLVLNIIMNFLMAVFANTLPIPAGVFVPVFTLGAAFGRLVGESMAAWFPEGIPSGDTVRKIVPGGYAVVGAASMSGSVTRTISTAVIVFEVTGQISHVLPAVIAVLIANAVANIFQPSFYDSIIKLKKLPYLPDIVSAKSNAWLLYVEDFMVSETKFIAFDATYKDLQELIMTTRHRSYPLVDSKNSMILLGSVQRLELERLLLVHLSKEQKVMWHWGGNGRVTDSDSSSSNSNSRDSSPTKQHGQASEPATIASGDSASPNKSAGGAVGPGVGVPVSGPRFKVTKVNETEIKPQDTDELDGNGEAIPMKLLSVPTQRPYFHGTKDSQSNYYTVHAPLRSILKKSSSGSKLSRAHSTGDLQEDMNNFYRKLAKQRKESIVEDRPYIIKKGSMPNINRKVKMQEAWELRQLVHPIDWEGVQIDPAPFQLVERTSLHKVHSLFSLLGLNHAFVTNTGRLVGVVGLKELRSAVQGQIELQENGKRVLTPPELSSPSGVGRGANGGWRHQDVEDDEEGEAMAPIDDTQLEVVKQSGTSEAEIDIDNFLAIRKKKNNLV
ncbi:chloride channel protein [Elysia marginata]|uniref:Chloride channel protein n=1 Tax=Elysia marginata TaxID=1093978 RepID=A0AAV4GEC5_9GAST|nr:chloride channel protein [Elysia marginata]